MSLQHEHRLPPRKEDAPCCMSKVDAIGRPPLGFCSPECIRRPKVWAAMEQARLEAEHSAAVARVVDAQDRAPRRRL